MPQDLGFEPWFTTWESSNIAIIPTADPEIYFKQSNDWKSELEVLPCPSGEGCLVQSRGKLGFLFLKLSGNIQGFYTWYKWENICVLNNFNLLYHYRLCLCIHGVGGEWERERERENHPGWGPHHAPISVLQPSPCQDLGHMYVHTQHALGWLSQVSECTVSHVGFSTIVQYATDCTIKARLDVSPPFFPDFIYLFLHDK